MNHTHTHIYIYININIFLYTSRWGWDFRPESRNPITTQLLAIEPKHHTNKIYKKFKRIYTTNTFVDSTANPHYDGPKIKISCHSSSWNRSNSADNSKCSLCAFWRHPEHPIVVYLPFPRHTTHTHTHTHFTMNVMCLKPRWQEMRAFVVSSVASNNGAAMYDCVAVRRGKRSVVAGGILTRGRSGFLVKTKR